MLSGDIPWVTVGLPNGSYTIQSHSQAVAVISPANSNGFSGVRVDLDKDYLPGQTFTIQFAVLQSNLLERLTDDTAPRINQVRLPPRVPVRVFPAPVLVPEEEPPGCSRKTLHQCQTCLKNSQPQTVILKRSKES